MKTKKIEFRCSSLEQKIIQRKASESGLSTSEYCRATALNRKTGNRLTPEELEAYQTLATFTNNFTRIGNLLRKKDSKFAQEVQATADEIRTHLRKLQ